MAQLMWFKGRAAIALDAWYADDPTSRLEEAKDMLTSGDAFDDLAGRVNPSFAGKNARREAVETDEEEFSFMYPIPDGKLRGDDFENVVRRGYLEAIGLAQGHTPHVPLTTTWMTGAGNPTFEMHITDGVDHVAVTLLVPDVEGGTTHAQSAESWIVKFDGAAAQVDQVSGPTCSDPPSLRGSTSSS